MSYVTSFERIAEKRGMQWGENKTLTRVLVKLLTLKFGSLPPWVDQRIENAGVAELNLWVERVLTADNLNDIFD